MISLLEFNLIIGELLPKDYSPRIGDIVSYYEYEEENSNLQWQIIQKGYQYREDVWSVRCVADFNEVSYIDFYNDIKQDILYYVGYDAIDT